MRIKCENIRTPTQKLVHQKNYLSFSYARGVLNRSNFDAFMRNKSIDRIQEDRSAYLHFVKNGMYHISDTLHTMCSTDQISRSYHKNDDVYFYLMQHLHLNGFQISGNKVECVPQKIKYVSSTFCPHDVLDINLNDYYRVMIKNIHRPIYLQWGCKLYDENGNSKKLWEIVKPGKPTRVLGLTTDHKLKVYEIDSIHNLNPEDEPFDAMDTPFYEIGCEKEEQEQEKGKLPVCIENILVELD